MSNDVFNLFVNDLTVLDCAIWHPQRGPIGMSWNVDIEFIGGVDDEGVVFDFSHAKKAAKKVIDDLADHRLVVPNKLTKPAPEKDSNELIINTDVPYSLFYCGPEEAFCAIDNASVSGLIDYLEFAILEEIDRENVYEVKLKFKDERDTTSDEPPHRFYHYTHGLKEHYGNCQRLFHGHQSTVKVFVNGVQRKDIELAVCDLFADKHLAYLENIVENEDSEDKRIHVKYESSQGTFEAKIARENVLIFPYETTVEYISKYIAEWVLTVFPATATGIIEVHAYEGIGKGSRYIKTPSRERNESNMAKADMFNKPDMQPLMG